MIPIAVILNHRALYRDRGFTSFHNSHSYYNVKVKNNNCGIKNTLFLIFKKKK